MSLSEKWSGFQRHASEPNPSAWLLACDYESNNRSVYPARASYGDMPIRMKRTMKLIRTIDRKIGLVVLLPDGPHVIDILKSLAVFAPHDPLANGLLNGALKDGCDWSQIIKHWPYLRGPLKKLASIAKVCPDHQCLKIRPLTEQLELKGAGDQIIAIEITESASLEEREPTGRRTTDRQSGVPPATETQRHPPPTVGTAQIIDFSRRGKIGLPRP